MSHASHKGQKFDDPHTDQSALEFLRYSHGDDEPDKPIVLKIIQKRPRRPSPYKEEFVDRVPHDCLSPKPKSPELQKSSLTTP